MVDVYFKFGGHDFNQFFFDFHHIFAGRKAGYAGDGIPCLRPVVPKVFCRVVVVHMVRMMGGVRPSEKYSAEEAFQ